MSVVSCQLSVVSCQLWLPRELWRRCTARVLGFRLWARATPYAGCAGMGSQRRWAAADGRLVRAAPRGRRRDEQGVGGGGARQTRAGRAAWRPRDEWRLAAAVRQCRRAAPAGPLFVTSSAWAARWRCCEKQPGRCSCSAGWRGPRRGKRCGDKQSLGRRGARQRGSGGDVVVTFRADAIAPPPEL